MPQQYLRTAGGAYLPTVSRDNTDRMGGIDRSENHRWCHHAEHGFGPTSVRVAACDHPIWWSAPTHGAHQHA